MVRLPLPEPHLRILDPMTDQPTAASTPAAAPAFDPERRATELAILDALRNVVDPEIGMNVVELALIKQILLGETESEVKMILTTPFCPYAGSMIAQVKEQAESVAGPPGQGDPPRRALGPARRGPHVVSEDTAASRSPAAPHSAVATGRGDDGTTGLLFGGDRIPKDDLRTEAYGTVDEAVAALGLARAELDLKRRIGRPAAGPRRDRGPHPAGPARAVRRRRRAGRQPGRLGSPPRRRDAGLRRDGRRGSTPSSPTTRPGSRSPPSSSCPGETRTSAALELARTILRRAERRAVTLERAGLVPGEHLLPYLNRLADLLWVLARAAEQAESRTSTAARPRRRARTARRPVRRNEGRIAVATGRRGLADPGPQARIAKVRHTQPIGGTDPRRHDGDRRAMTQQTYAPSQLGVRPDARLAQAFLTQSFFWMFLGLLVTTAVGVMVSSLSTETLVSIAGLSIFLIIAQLGVAIVLTRGDPEDLGDRRPAPVLRLRGAHRRDARLHSRCVRARQRPCGGLVGGGGLRRRGDLRRRHEAEPEPASAPTSSWA